MKEYIMRGDYNKSSDWQLKVNLKSLPILNNYIKETADSLTHSHLRIGDFGCSAGRNSFIIFNKVFEELRQYSSIPVHITHEDLASNRWENFFRDAQKLDYFNNPNTFVSIIGKSFYYQVFPDATLHLAYSACAMHYLSQQIDCPDHIVVYLSKDQEIREKARQQARSDMITILEHRAKEIITGGFLILNNFIYTGEGNSPLEMLQKFNESLKDNEVLTAKEIERMTRSSYMNTVSEWQDILTGVSHLYNVKLMETHDVRCPHYDNYLEDQNLEKFSVDMMECIRTWHEGSVRDCLQRDEHEEELVVNLYFEKMKIYIYQNVPELKFFNIILVLQVI